MADKNWQAGGRKSIAAQALLCLAAAVLPFTAAQVQAQAQAKSQALAGVFVPASYFGPIEPNVAWEIAIGGTVLSAFLGALAFWVHTALRRLKRTQLRHTAYISTALNSLNHGVVMTDPKMRIVYVNDRYLEIYGLKRSDLPPVVTGDDLLNLRRSQGLLDVSVEQFYRLAARPEGLITELPGGRSVHARHFPLPNGGSIATHEDCSEQRKLSRQLASTKQFLESVLDNVPVCVAAKSIEGGRYIFANRAFERFSHFSRDRIVGHRADEIFRPDTAAAVEAADRAALEAPNGHYTTELVVERGRETRVLASDRVIARNEKGDPEFLIALFEDVTDRRSLSRELEDAKKFLELVVDNIPVSLIVERVSDGSYLLANRSAEAIMNRRREEVTGLTARDIFHPKEANLIISRDEAAIKKRGMISEEHPISTKDGLRLFLTRRATVVDEAGQPQYLIKTHEDVTDRRQTESSMAHMAYHDGLTDLPNRTAFLQALAQMIEACAGTDEEFAVLCVDLDGLKEVNDVFGHATGDKQALDRGG
jgi:PAS domain S-box-containing protein